jgi:hypothetical protein
MPKPVVRLACRIMGSSEKWPNPVDREIWQKSKIIPPVLLVKLRVQQKA